MRLEALLPALALLCGLPAAPPSAAETAQPEQSAAERWSRERAWKWHRAHAPLLGFNYVPGYAGTSAGIWQAEDFDPRRIDLELGWAEKARLDDCRIFIQYIDVGLADIVEARK